MKKRSLQQRSIIIAIVAVVGLYVVIGPHGRRPHFSDLKWSGIKANLARNIHLGLDLRGGSHLVMRVKIEEYLKRLTENNAIAAQNADKDQGFQVTEAHADTSNGNYRVVMTIGDASKVKDAREAVQKKVEVSDNAGWSFTSSGATMTWSLNGATQRTLAESATDQALKIIDSRIN